MDCWERAAIEIRGRWFVAESAKQNRKTHNYADVLTRKRVWGNDRKGGRKKNPRYGGA